MSGERPEGVFLCAFQGTWADLVRTARNNMSTFRAKTQILFFELTGFPSQALSLQQLCVCVWQHTFTL